MRSLARAVLVLFLLVVPAELLAQSWYDQNWGYRKKITVDHTLVGGTLSDFPVLVDITDTDLANDAQNDGDDILFTADDGTTKLSHEIEDFDGASGALVAWVSVPSLSGSSDTDIYMYYGNAGASNQEDGTGTWDTSFELVYHLHDDFNDATSNGRNGTNNGSLDTGGMAGDGQEFDRGSCYYVDTNWAPSFSGDLAFEGWFRLSSQNGTGDVLGVEDRGGGDNSEIRMAVRDSDSDPDGKNGNPQQYDIELRPDNGDIISEDDFLDTNIANGSWHHLALVRDGTTGRLFYDGQEITLNDNSVGSGTASFPVTVLVGAQWQTDSSGQRNCFNGDIDEARISTSARSPAYFETVYNNGTNGGFLTVSTEEPAPSYDVDVTPDGLGSPVQRQAGTDYSQAYTVTNNSTVQEDFDLLARTEPTASFLTIDSITAAGFSQSGDSARVTGMGVGQDTTITVWYTVDIATDGRVDTLYLQARSVSDPATLDEGWAEVEYDAPAASLLGRYWFHEAPSGQTPDTAYDDQASPVDLAITWTDSLEWTLNGGHRGLLSRGVGHVGIAEASIAGTKYETQLDSIDQLSMAYVTEYADGTTGQMIGGFLGTGPFGSAPAPAIAGLNADEAFLLGVRTKDQSVIRVSWSLTLDLPRRTVFHVVYDAQHDTANRRIRLYMGGTDQGVGNLLVGSWPAQGEALDFDDTGVGVRMMNAENGDNPLDGIVYYFSVYKGMLTDSEISSDASALDADDDNLSLDVDVTPDGLDTIPRLPSNGTSYSYKYTLTNNSTVWDDYDLFGFPGDGTFLTADSVAGPNVSTGTPPDSARITGVAPGASDSVFVWYNVADVAAGSRDSLYLLGRSFSSTTVRDSGWAFIDVVKPNMTTVKSVDPSGTQSPGTDLTYTVTITNNGSDDAVDVVIVDSLAAELEFKVNSVVNNLPAGIGVTVEYSDDGGSTWTYTPTSGGCGATTGYDACVNRIRWTLQDDLSSVGPDNTGDVEFVARIK